MRAVRRDRWAAATVLVLLSLGLPAPADEAIDEFDVFESPVAGSSGAEVSLESEVAVTCLPETAKTAVSGFVEPGIRIEPWPGVSFSAAGAASFEGEIASDAAPALTIGLPEAALTVSLRDVVFLEAGIIGMSAGSDPVWRPTAWFERYSANPYAPAGRSFLGLGLSAYLGVLKIGFTILPELGLPTYDLFEKPTSGSAAEVRISASLLGGSIAALGFVQTEADSLVPRFAGAGFEAQIPLSTWLRVKAEGLYSSGRTAWGIDNALLVPLADSAPRFEGLGSASFTVLSRLEVGVGYLYSGRGLDAQAWRTVYEYLAASTSTDALYESAAQGYLAMSQGADAFLRHRLMAWLGVPRITDWAGATLYAFVAPQDGSTRFLLELFAEAPRMSTVHVRVELSPWPPETAYGSSSQAVSISVIAGFSARERF